MALDVTIWILSSLLSLCVCRECSDTWILGATLDIEGTEGMHAQLAFTRTYLAKNTTQCANDCCLQLHGSCDLATFAEKDNKATCSHYQCSPIERCRFKRDNDSEAYLVSVSATENQSLSYLDEPSTFEEEPPTKSEGVHGDGTKSKARKGALLDEEPPLDAPLKHDNTTIVPRKGVPPVFAYHQSFNGSSSSSSPFLEGQDTAVNYTAYLEEDSHRDADGKNASSRQDNDHDETNTSSEGVSYAMRNESSTAKPPDMTSSTTIVSTTMAVEPIGSLKPHGLRLTETRTQPIAVEPTGSLKPHGLRLTEPRTQPVAVEPTGSLKPNEEHFSGSSAVVPVFGPNWNISEPSDSEVLFKTNGNMHLVVGLVVGLLVVLLVIGLVAKRIHDSWLRRHYHRMDFLIDGMYHGDP